MAQNLNYDAVRYTNAHGDLQRCRDILIEYSQADGKSIICPFSPSLKITADINHELKRNTKLVYVGAEPMPQANVNVCFQLGKKDFASAHPEFAEVLNILKRDMLMGGRVIRTVIVTDMTANSKLIIGALLANQGTILGHSAATVRSLLCKCTNYL
jgi:hypothetical protein